MIAITEQIAAMSKMTASMAYHLSSAHVAITMQRPRTCKVHIQEVLAQATAVAEMASAALKNIPGEPHGHT